MSDGHSSRVEPLILNVNDNEAARYMVTLVLQRAGFLVIEASSGLAALDKIARRKPDLVVLDVKLPDMSGLEVCRRIRLNPDTASTKILHTSATYVTVDNKVQSLQGGSDGYLPQPFEAEELVAIVRSLLRLNDAEQELRRDAAELREADRRKNEFLSMLAHELRNPLAAISAALPILSRHAPSDDVERRARGILERQTAHLARLIDDLLDVARVTQGKIELKWAVIDLGELLQRVVEAALGAKVRARNQGVELLLPEQPVHVRGDATRLEQLFTNLLDNASQYSDPGGSIRLALAQHPDGTAHVTVRDNGIGISAETLPNIFGLFSQADVPLARSRGGLGIGLTLVRTLVELHGGSVVARSGGLGTGSEFEVSLPAITLDFGDRTPSGVHDRGGMLASRRRHVLVVEDNVDAQQMLVDLLGMWGHKVDAASDGIEGVSRVLSGQPDVALIDIGLPGIDGYEVARRIRRAQPDKRPTLIALTGYGSPEQKSEALGAGFDMHLVKPVDPAQLEGLLSQGFGGPAPSSRSRSREDIAR